MRFSDACLAELKAKARITDWIDGTPGLRKNGRDYTCRCVSPNHDDKKPSMSIQTAENFAYCFSCGHHCDVIGWVQDTQGLNFQESVIRLADHYGVNLEGDSKEQDKKFREEQKKRQQLLSHKKQQLITWQQRLLNEGPVSYLMDRGFEPDTIMDWHLGWDGQRVQFPINDHSGQLVGFTGRWPGDPGNRPKWKHSRDDLVFSQGRILFGLDRARPHIKKAGFVVIVEGHGDVVMCHQRGINNVVGGVGTSLTADQVNLLLQYSITNWVFALDGDDAGRNAVARHIHKLREKLISEGITAKVAQLPQGEDPGSTDLSPLLGQAVQWWDFLFDYALRDFNPDDLATVQESEARVERLLESMPAGSVFSHIKARADAELSYSAKAKPAAVAVLTPEDRQIRIAEARALRLALNFPECRAPLEELPLCNEDNRTLRIALFALIDVGTPDDQLGHMMWSISQGLPELRGRVQNLLHPNPEAWAVVTSDPIKEMESIMQLLECCADPDRQT